MKNSLVNFFVLALITLFIGCKEDNETPKKEESEVTRRLLNNEKWLWVKHVQAPNNETSVNLFFTDNQANTYLSGNIIGNISFEREKNEPITLTGSGQFPNYDSYLVKYDKNGEFENANKTTENINNGWFGLQPAVDLAGNIYNFHHSWDNTKYHINTYQTTPLGTTNLITGSYYLPGYPTIYAIGRETGVNFVFGAYEYTDTTPVKVYDTNLTLIKDLLLNDIPQGKTRGLHNSMGDDLGNLFLLSGGYDGPFDVPGHSYKTYLTKFDKNLNKLWETILPDPIEIYAGVSSLEAIHIETDKTNNSFFAFRDLADSNGYRIIKYDPQGNLIWQQLLTNTFYSTMAVDEIGSLYFATQLGGEKSQFGSTLIYNSIPNIQREGDIVIAKFNAQGTVLWTEQIKGKFFNPRISLNDQYCFLTAQYTGNNEETTIGSIPVKGRSQIIACLYLGKQ
jgi:hypothetical protein